MGMTISNAPADNSLLATITLPDSGQAVTVTGAIFPSTPQELAFTGTSVTAPSPPGSGSIYWMIQVNMTTAAVTMQQSTVSMPALSAGCQLLFQQVLTPSNTDEALDSTDVTPDV